MNLELGPLETQLIGYCQSRGIASLGSGETVRALRWTPEQERKVLSQLARKGLAVRLRRGRYLLPLQLPIGGHWNPGEYFILSSLMDDCNGTYQITGPNAFHRYGWTEQIPNRIYAYNNRISGDRQIGVVALTLIEVKDNRLGATETAQTPEGIAVNYSSKARALVDAVYDWARFDTLPRAYEWIGREIRANDGFASELVKATIRYGDQGTNRRIGAILERLEVPDALLRRVERTLRVSRAMTPMIPRSPKRSNAPRGQKTNKRWGVTNNDE